MTGNPMFAHGMMGPMIMKRAFQLADADKDGRLTDAEIDSARTAQFDKHDANGDGRLTLEEFDSLLRELTQPVAVRAFQFLDPDGDAVITKEEFDGPTTRIVRFLDRNEDGALSIDDRPDFHRGGFSHGRYDEEDDDN
ncbi:EF-hand domain-containing protein [Microbaculum marinum]